MSAENKKIDTLTGARFIAIALIVLSHFEFLRQYPYGGGYWKYLHNATFGVDYFFMLSGFGMMLSWYRKKDFDLSIRFLCKFAWNHVSNLYPLYVGMLIAGMPWYILLEHYDLGRSIVRSVVVTCLHFIAALTLLQSATGFGGISHSINGVCWFLSCLFCIYLVSPIIMRTLKRISRTRSSAITVFLLSIAFSFISAVAFQAIEAKTVFDELCYGSPYRRVFYVISGMAVAQYYLFNTRNTSKYLEYFAFSVSAIWFFIREDTIPALGAFCYVVDMILCGLDLFALAQGKGIISKLLGSKLMVKFGALSMYIFLTHYIIRNYIDFIFRHFKLESPAGGLIEVLLICGLTAIVSLVLQRYGVAQGKRR